MSSLLTIGETAKLMGVCENTLRDWDENGTFEALRTPGNHRRYDIDQIREWLDQNQTVEERKEEVVAPPVAPEKEYVRRIFPEDLRGESSDDANLRVLLENQYLFETKKYAEGGDALSLDEKLTLVIDTWRQIRLKHFIDVHPMEQPVCLVPIYSRDGDRLSVSTEPIAARTTKFQTPFLPGMDMKLLAKMLALEIDGDICRTIGRHTIYDFDSLSAYLSDPTNDVAEDFDLVVAGPELIRQCRENVRIHHGDTMQRPVLQEGMVLIDEETFCPRVFAGKTLKASSTTPKQTKVLYCPHILAFSGPTVFPGFNPVMTRAGWYESKPAKKIEIATGLK